MKSWRISKTAPWHRVSLALSLIGGFPRSAVDDQPSKSRAERDSRTNVTNGTSLKRANIEPISDTGVLAPSIRDASTPLCSSCLLAFLFALLFPTMNTFV